MKRVLSLALSLVMTFSIITGMDVSVFATDTEQVAYNIPRAEYYAENFSDFIILENSSFPSVFLESLQEDSLFMGEVAVWESLHIAESPADSAESGLISKADYYKTVLFDLLINKKADSLLETSLDFSEPLVEDMSNNKTANLVNLVQSILYDETNNATLENISSLSLTENIKKGFNSYMSDAQTKVDVAAILELSISAYDAACLISDYFALKDVSDSTMAVLNYIANDTNNDYDLRYAATDCMVHVEFAYNAAFANILSGAASVKGDVLKIFVNNAWSAIASSIPFVNIAYASILGSRAMLNVLFSEDERIASYYQLEASVTCENALLRAMDGLKTEFSDNKTIDTANNYMKAVDMYKSTVLLGCDYSIELLETIVNSRWNIITGSYNEAVETINNINQNKSHRINIYNKFEELAFKVYLINYCPEYYETLKYLDGTYVPITSMEVNQIKSFYLGNTYSLDESFSVNYLPKNYTEEYMDVTITSSDENILKVVGEEFTPVNAGTCTLTFVSEDGRFSVSKSVTVQEYPEDGYDYLSYFEYSINDDNETVTIIGYTGDLAHVVIPSYIGDYKVTSIGKRAFYNCDNIVSIRIPEGVSNIGYDAFYGCTCLLSVIIPASVTYIGDEVFYNCVNLENIYWNAKKVDDFYLGNIFYNAGVSGSGITLVFGDTVEVIPAYLGYVSYSSCFPNIVSVVTGNNVKSIGEYAFAGCENLIDIKLNDGLLSIEACAFTGTKINEVRIPSTVNSMCSYVYNDSFDGDISAFNGAKNLKIVTFENGILNIPDNALRSCSSVTTVNLPSGLTSIGEYSFAFCSSLAGISIPDSVTSIGSFAFSECEGFDSITIPDSVMSIGEDAFSGCTNLTSIKIGNSVTSIGDFAFLDCTNISSVYITDIGAWCEIDFAGSTANPMFYTNKLYLNGELVTEIVIPEEVTRIGAFAFLNCTSLKSITMPNSITSIGSYAFEYCDSLTSVIIPDSVTNMGVRVFQGCTNLISVTIGNGVPCIKNATFNGCTKLTSVSIPNSVASIEKYAFCDCTSLVSITIPESVTSIGDYAFENCTNLSSIVIPDGVSCINTGVFSNCTNLSCITIPDKIESIGSYAFQNCKKLELLEIPESVTNIGKWAFYNCESLTSVIIPENTINIGEYGFYSCENLEDVIIGNNVTTIGESSFENCSNLVSVAIGNNVTSIGKFAFLGCTNISSVNITDIKAWCEIDFANDTSNPLYYSDNFYLNDEIVNDIVLPEDTSKIGDYAFNRYDNLVSITMPNSVTSIGSCAFGSCWSLNYVFYSGSESDWAKTTIDSDNEYLTDALIHFNSTDHTYEDKIDTEATCTNDGLKHPECIICGYSLESKVIEATGHNYSTEWTIDIEATCTENGSKSHHCTGCGDKVDITVIEATGHSYSEEWTIDVEATCTENGSKSHHCTGCSDKVDITVIEATGHSYSEEWTIDVEATCTENGSKSHHCIGCGDKVDITVIEATGHSYSEEWTIDVEATCTEKGSKSHHCINCGDKKDITEIEATGHNYVNGYCTYCDGCVDFEYSVENDSVTITGYNGTDAEVVIPSTIVGLPVTVIGENAFDSCWNITSITIPDSVTTISKEAFYFCTKLSSVTIPKSVTNIGQKGFYYCSKLTSVNVDENNTNYSSVDGVLFNKDKTTLIQYPEGKANVEYTIPDGVTSINDYAFCNCANLASIAIPNSVINIGKDAFNDCSSLTTINIPSSTTSIDSSAFDYCENLTAINVDENNSKYLSIDGVLIDKTKSQLIRYPQGKPDTEYVIPAGVTSIYSDSFYRCTNLTTITISEGVTDIDYFAFYNCKNLNSVILSNSVTNIGYYAFYGCTKLSSATIPDNVTDIGTSAFGSLTQIYCYENSAAHNYAVDNSLEYILIKLHSVNNKANIDYDNSLIFSFTDICTDIEKIISTAQNYILSVSESLSAGNTKLYGTGSKVVVEDELSNTTEYTIITVGDLNGDSVCDVLDAAQAQRYSSGLQEPTENEIYAANGCIAEEIDVNSYQNVVNQALAS